MKVVDFSQQRVIVGSILIEHGVTDDNHLYLFHVKCFMLFHCARIYDIDYTSLSKFAENLLPCFLTFEENISRMVCADEDNAEVHSEISNINIE